MNTNKKANTSIICSVEECQHHCCNENYCSLDCVRIGTHECSPTVKQCVDCESFELKGSVSDRDICSGSNCR